MIKITRTIMVALNMKKSEYEDGNVPMFTNDYRNGLESIMDLPQVGAVYTNSTGGSCKIIAVDEPSLSEEYRLDNFQITYQMGDGDIVCHKWKNVRNLLEYNGYDYKASAKKSKSQPVSFSDMVKKQRTKNNNIVKFDTDTTFVSDKLNEALVPLKEAMESWDDFTPEGQRVGAEIMEAVMSIEEVLERIK